VRDADLAEQFHGLGPGLLPRLLLVEEDRLGDLVADAHDRVEAGHRLLENHRDAVAADLAHLRRGHREQIAALEEYPPRDHFRGRFGQQAQDGEGVDALAGARFADDGESLAGVEVVGDAVDRRDGPFSRLELRPQSADAEDGLH